MPALTQLRRPRPGDVVCRPAALAGLEDRYVEPVYSGPSSSLFVSYGRVPRFALVCAVVDIEPPATGAVLTFLHLVPLGGGSALWTTLGSYRPFLVGRPGDRHARRRSRR